MKKISLILVLTILCSLFSVFTPASVSAAALGAEEMNLLLCIGAEAEKELGDTLTVGDFAKLLAASIFNPEDYLLDDSDEKVVEYSVLALNKHGILEDGIDPAATLDFDVTIKALVNMLGYGQVAQINGYKIQAAELGILKGVYPADESAVTMGEAVVMIYNSLFINLLEMAYLTNPGMEYTQSNFETILTKNRDIYRYKGFLYDNGITSVTGNSTVNENHVKIGDLVMNVGETNIADYLAYYVDVFYTDTGDDYIINCFKVTEKENKIIYIDSDDIKDGSTLTSIDYDVDEKTRHANVSTQASYIFNGSWTLSLTNNDIKPANGGVTLVDVDFNDVYDIIMVDSFKNVLVKEVASEDFIIIGMYDGRSYTDDQGNVQIYNDFYNFAAQYEEEEISVYKNGIKVPFSTIAPYDTLAVYEGDEYLKIEICGYVENAEVKSVDNKGITTAEGVEVDFAPEYAKVAGNDRPAAGAKGVVYFGKAGDIIYFEASARNIEVTAYLHQMYFDDVEGQAYMKVFTEKGNWEKLDFGEKVYINDVKKEEKDLYLEPILYNADGTTDRQLLQYTTNVDGEVKKIYTTASTNDDSLRIAGPTGTYYYSDVLATKGSFYYGSVGISDEDEADFYVESTTTFFRVPNDPLMEDVYRVYTGGQVPYGHSKYPTGITGYYATLDAEKRGTVDYIVQGMDSASVSYDHRFAIVMDFGEIVDESGDVRTFITVLEEGKEKTYYSMNGKIFNGIQKGDAVALAKFNGEITGYAKYFSINAKMASSDIINGGYSANDLKAYYNMNDINTLIDSSLFVDSTNTGTRGYYSKSSWYGTITHKDGKYLTLRLADGTEKKFRADEGAPATYYRTQVSVYDEKTKTASKGSLNDIHVGSKVYTRFEGGLMTDVLVVKTK